MQTLSRNQHRFQTRWAGFGAALFLAGRVALAQGAVPPTAVTPPEAALKAIHQAITAKQFAEARTLSQSFMVQFGTDKRVPEVLFLKGQAEFYADNKPAAQNTWQSLITTHPRTDAAARALEQLIPLAESKNQMTEREILRRRLLQDFPDHPATVRVFVADGEAKAKRNEYTAAIADYQQMVARLSDPQKKRLQELMILGGRPQKFLSEQEKLSDLMQRAGQLVNLGSCGEAAKLYAEVSRQFAALPQAAEAHYRRGLCLSEAKNYKEAISAWQATQELKVGDQWQEFALFEIARTQAFKLKEYDKAIGNYKQFLQRYPKSSRQMEVEYQLAGVLYLKHDYPAAKAQFAKFIVMYPQSSVLVEAKGYLAKCETTLKTAEEVSRKGAEAQRKQEAKSVTPPAPQTDWLAQADAAQKSGDHRAAFTLYERIIIGHRNTPEYEPAMYRGGQCLRDMGELQKAQRLWEDFLRVKPQSALADDVLLALGDLYFEDLHQPVQAQAAYQRLVADFPSSELAGQAKHRSGLALFRQNQWERAREIFVAEQKAKGGPNPNAPPTELDRLILACDTKKVLVSLGSVSAKLNSAPGMLNNLEGQVATADTLFTAGQHAKAALLYERVVKAAPGGEEAAYSLMQAGRSYGQMRKYEKAMACYRQFLDKYRSSRWASEALIRAGVIYAGPLRQRAQGEKVFTTIVERYPQGSRAAEALFNLGSLAYWNSEWEKSLRIYRSLDLRYPNSPYARFANDKLLPKISAQLNPSPQLGAN